MLSATNDCMLTRIFRGHSSLWTLTSLLLKILLKHGLKFDPGHNEVWKVLRVKLEKEVRLVRDAFERVTAQSISTTLLCALDIAPVKFARYGVELSE